MALAGESLPPDAHHRDDTRPGGHRRLRPGGYTPATEECGRTPGADDRPRHRSPGARTYCVHTYPHGSTSGTSTTPNRHSVSVSAVAASNWPASQSGSPNESTQITFHASSMKSSGSIFSG